MNICRSNWQRCNLFVPRKILDPAISNKDFWGCGYAPSCDDFVPFVFLVAWVVSSAWNVSNNIYISVEMRCPMRWLPLKWQQGCCYCTWLLIQYWLWLWPTNHKTLRRKMITLLMYVLSVQTELTYKGTKTHTEKNSGNTVNVRSTAATDSEISTVAWMINLSYTNTNKNALRKIME